ncbi:MAG TPA: 1-phosphofructokinase family hexose kinase [Chitinophagaceae bacterium]|nr:1-phosphofructokinase family hexose kinase [Chitinophagaceae bacterium]
MRIVTVTLNPCIDKSTTVPALLPEKKLRCTKPVLEPGGGGINVARAIQKLGGNATAVYLSGGYNGNLITRLLEGEHVAGLPVFIKNDTRENSIILDTTANVQYRFCMPGPYVEEEEWTRCLQILDAMTGVDYLVASGSLPPGVPADFFARLARQVKAKGVKLVVDTGGAGLKEALTEGIYMIKPNISELCEYAEVSSLSLENAGVVSREIIAGGRCEIILLSMGEAGALLVTKDLTMHIVPPQVSRKSTVGAGDSMTAGVILSLATGYDIISAAQYGVASGTAATMRPGTQLCDKTDADAIYARIKDKA